MSRMHTVVVNFQHQRGGVINIRHNRDCRNQRCQHQHLHQQQRQCQCQRQHQRQQQIQSKNRILVVASPTASILNDDDSCTNPNHTMKAVKTKYHLRTRTLTLTAETIIVDIINDLIFRNKYHRIKRKKIYKIMGREEEDENDLLFTRNEKRHHNRHHQQQHHKQQQQEKQQEKVVVASSLLKMTKLLLRKTQNRVLLNPLLLIVFMRILSVLSNTTSNGVYAWNHPYHSTLLYGRYYPKSSETTSLLLFVAMNEKNSKNNIRQIYHHHPHRHKTRFGYTTFTLFDSESTGTITVATATATTSEMSSDAEDVNDISNNNAYRHQNLDKEQQLLESESQQRVGSNTMLLSLDELQQRDYHHYDNDDVARPTPNGGYSHTAASRAKISAANKGKTPWNKGQQRSEEVRARIAAGVRKKNHERFLAKLQEMGLTYEQYMNQQDEQKRLQEADRQSRRTEKGGYRLTEETRNKISQVLKAKYANGEVRKRTPRNPMNSNNNNNNSTSTGRKGFQHSEETRRKISNSLRKLWATDEDYRINMIQKSTLYNTREDVRAKISTSLRLKWQDPIFREQMLTNFAHSHSTKKKHSSTNNKNSTPITSKNRNGRTNGTSTNDGNDIDAVVSSSLQLSHRERISAAMKLKWQDEEYRAKAMASLETRRRRNTTSTTTPTTTTTTTTKKANTKKVSSITDDNFKNTKAKVKGSSNKKELHIEANIHNSHNNRFGRSSTTGFDDDYNIFPDDGDDRVDDNEEEEEEDDAPVVVRMVEPLTQPRTKKGAKKRKTNWIESNESTTGASSSNDIEKFKKTSGKNSKKNRNLSLTVSSSTTSTTTATIATIATTSSSSTTGINNTATMRQQQRLIPTPTGSLSILDDYENEDDNNDSIVSIDKIDDYDDLQVIDSTSLKISTAKRISSTSNVRTSSSNVHHNHGSVDRLQEERPDLYELLYGDDDDHFTSPTGAGIVSSTTVNNNNSNNHVIPWSSSLSSSHKNNNSIIGYLDDDNEYDEDIPYHSAIRNEQNGENNNLQNRLLPTSPLFGDENLDTFDPYGLKNF